MIRNNLLPFRAARRRENIRRQISIFLLSFIFTSIALFYYHVQLNLQREELKTQSEDVKSRLKVFRKKAREVDQIKEALETLKKKIDTIKTLEMNRREPVRLMEAMTEVVIPQRMWFTDFAEKKVLDDAKTKEIEMVEIKGIALDNKTVADFMTQLEKLGVFVSVNLTTLKQVTIQKLNVKGFEIACEKIPLELTEEEKGKTQ